MRRFRSHSRCTCTCILSMAPTAGRRMEPIRPRETKRPLRITSKESRLAAPSTGLAKERGTDAKRGGAPGARPSFGTFAAFIQMNELGKLLFVTGLVLAAAGLILWSGVGRSWLG